MNGISFKVMGAPVPKGRPRFRAVGKFVQTYTPKKTLDAEKEIRKAFEEQNPTFRVPLNGPISLSIRFLMPIPASISKKQKETLKLKPHLKKPDTDNLVKTICDALNGYVWNDDSQICCIHAEKYYQLEVPCTIVIIEQLGEE